jgi:hypothetical protein
MTTQTLAERTPAGQAAAPGRRPDPGRGLPASVAITIVIALIGLMAGGWLDPVIQDLHTVLAR